MRWNIELKQNIKFDDGVCNYVTVSPNGQGSRTSDNLDPPSQNTRSNDWRKRSESDNARSKNPSLLNGNKLEHLHKRRKTTTHLLVPKPCDAPRNTDSPVQNEELQRKKAEITEEIFNLSVKIGEVKRVLSPDNMNFGPVLDNIESFLDHAFVNNGPIDNLPKLKDTKSINDEYLECFINSIYKHFRSIVDLRSYVLPFDRFLQRLASRIGDAKCIEVYAGNGILSHELRNKSVSIEAFDNFSSETHNESSLASFYRKNVTLLGARKAVDKFSGELGSQRGFVLMGFPVGDRETIRYVLETPTRNQNISIIAVLVGNSSGQNPDSSKSPFWKNRPKNIKVTNITASSCFASYGMNENVYLYEYQQPWSCTIL